MRLNRIEFLAMNSPLRAWVQRHVVAQYFLKLGGPVSGGTALEVGCGRGVGIEIILRVFGAAHVHGFDLDQRMVSLARRRSDQHGDAVLIWTGDACSIPRPSASYDAVFDFGIVHHVPDWRLAISEVHRVLKPQGRFYAEEVFARLTNGYPWRYLAKHPTEDRFDGIGFSEALADAGFALKESKNLGGYLGWFIAVKKGNLD